jgi:hypothetical protein
MIRSLAGPFALLALAVASAAPYGVGSVIPALTLEDQHGDRAQVDEGTRILVVTRDMDAGDIVKAALGDADQQFLDQRRAVYVADISGMPALIARMIGVPRMQKRPYRVLLDRDGSVTRDLPHVAGKPTVVVVEKLRITRIEHPATAEELRKALGD